MWPSLRDGVIRFFTDKAFFEAKMDKQIGRLRGALLMVGAAIAIPGTGLTEKIEAVVSPEWRPYVGLGIMGASVMLRAGDRTPANVKALAAEHDAQVPVSK